MGVANADDIGASAQDAGMDRPFVRRRFLAAEIIAVEVEHNQAMDRRAARTDSCESDERFLIRNSHADVTEAIGDALVVENVAGADEFLFEFLEIGGIE
jgi:hypothetical protein